MSLYFTLFFFFFNDTATTEIYTLSLHDALPISIRCPVASGRRPTGFCEKLSRGRTRSEEHTSELQSRLHLVCRLLLEKKKKKQIVGYARRINIDSVEQAEHERSVFRVNACIWSV